MSEEEKEAIKELIDSSNLSLIGDGTMIVKNTTIATTLNYIEKLQKENTELKDNQLWSEATIEGLKERFIPKEKVDAKIKELKEEESKIKNKGTLLIDEEKKTISHYGVEGMNDVINLVAIRKEIDFLEKISNKE